MEMLTYFKSLSQAMFGILFLGAIGFILVRKKVISGEGLTGLTRFLIEVTFPALIFWQIVTKFSFSKYPNWWVFTLTSLIITALGFFAGHLFSLRVKDTQLKREFLCLAGFQNAGYLPLVLLGWIVPKEQLSTALIYLFLLILGFDLVFWSWGLYFLSSHRLKSFSLPSLFSPPVIATLTGFSLILLNINSRIPKFVLSPLEMLGNCSFPLAIVVVGASLAGLSINKSPYIKNIVKLIFVKLIMLPVLGLVFLSYVKLPYLFGLLLILELSVPSATSLAIVSRRYGTEEKIISQGVFLTHILSLLTIPVFLSLFNGIVSSH